MVFSCEVFSTRAMCTFIEAPFLSPHPARSLNSQPHGLDAVLHTDLDDLR